MRLIALIAIAVPAAGVWCGYADARPLAPFALGAVGAKAPPIERVANVCGINGCAPIWTKRVQKPPPGFLKRAVPIVVQANPHQNAAPLR